jgi:transcriptional regulator with XRE-family HTH domain
VSSPAYALCKQIRSRSELSQRALAEAAGVSPSTIARIERGRLEPTLDLLLRLVEGAGLSLRLVLEDDDGRERRKQERWDAMSTEERERLMAQLDELRGSARGAPQRSDGGGRS